MPNKNYRRGHAHENYVKMKYEKMGFHVTRSASSKGLFDLIAIKRPSENSLVGNERLGYLIQCKTGKSARAKIVQLQKSHSLDAWNGFYQFIVRFE